MAMANKIDSTASQHSSLSSDDIDTPSATMVSRAIHNDIPRLPGSITRGLRLYRGKPFHVGRQESRERRKELRHQIRRERHRLEMVDKIDAAIERESRVEFKETNIMELYQTLLGVFVGWLLSKLLVYIARALRSDSPADIHRCERGL